METVNGNTLSGWIADKTSSKDYRLDFTDAQVPDRVDLRDGCTTVENQGTMNSCTANAAVGALEYLLRHRNGGTAIELSRLFVYYNTRRLRGSIHQDTGAMIPEAMAAVLAFGACRAELWPYNPDLFLQEPAPQAYQDGLRNEAIHYARVAGANGAIHALAEGLPVVFGTFLPGRCYHEVSQSGALAPTTQDERNTPFSNGHAMLLVGYDMSSQTFLIRNSWGTQWAAQGYCTCSFEDLAYFSPVESFWTMLELEAGGRYSLQRPNQAVDKTHTTRVDPFSESSGLREAASKMRQQIAGDIRSELDAASQKIDELLTPVKDQKPGLGGDLIACDFCLGSGTCWYCSDIDLTVASECTSCMGNRRCGVCGGTGRV